MNLHQLKLEICDIGQRIYNKGFAAGNDGNISYRLGDNQVLCTPTFISKGFMKPDDLCIVETDDALLVIPLAVDHLRPLRVRALAGVVLWFTIGTVGLFGLTALATGEWNYQGAAAAADRRTFHTQVPFDDAGTPFDVAGNTMVTNDADTGTVLAPDTLAASAAVSANGFSHENASSAGSRGTPRRDKRSLSTTGFSDEPPSRISACHFRTRTK